QVDAGQFTDIPVADLWPYHRFGIAAAVDAAFDDRDRNIAGLLDRHGADLGDLQLQVRPALQIEAFMHVDLLREPEETDVERRDAPDRASQRLIGGQPIDVREPVDEEGKYGNDGNQSQESTIDAHARESIGEPR